MNLTVEDKLRPESPISGFTVSISALLDCKQNCYFTVDSAGFSWNQPVIHFDTYLISKYTNSQ